MSEVDVINTVVMDGPGIDVIEDDIQMLDERLLRLLLKDKTTNSNIIWATADYENLGSGFEEFSEITPELITGAFSTVIQPRITKTQNAQDGRTREKDEVFTPCWICNKQNNLVDERWFGRPHVFNIEEETSWTPTQGKIEFPNPKRTWKKYVDEQRLEVSCGEAPYLVSRYDAVTGEKIPLHSRVGLLDRKMRVVDENADTDEEWVEWTIRAFQSVYGFEYQGDNLLLARENLFYTFIDYYQARFGVNPDLSLMRKIALIISWNIWQMDGLKCVVPNSCKPVLVQQMSLFDTDAEPEPCPGCAKNDMHRHTGKYCKIMDWRFKTSRTFISMMKGGDGCANV